jgi:hypothetical protein
VREMARTGSDIKVADEDLADMLSGGEV